MPNYTSNLKLEKPLVTDNYDINVSNGNMDKIDLEVKKLQDNKSNNGHTHTKSNITDFAHTHSMGEITGLELSSTKVMRPNQKTVEQSISANETSILTLQNNDGDLSQLQTSNKTNLVGAINEINASASSSTPTYVGNLNDLQEHGKTVFANHSTTSKPTSDNYYVSVITYPSGNKPCLQMAYLCTASGGGHLSTSSEYTFIYIRCKMSSTTWSKWKPIDTKSVIPKILDLELNLLEMEYKNE